MVRPPTFLYVCLKDDMGRGGWGGVEGNKKKGMGDAE